jgi:phage terminase small subunit
MPRHTRTDSGLTDKQQRFVAEFLFDLNATAAAKRAGYSGSTVNNTAYELLKRPAVQAALAKAMAARSQATGIKSETVLTALERIALAAEKERKYDQALKGWELVGKHLGMFRDKVEHTGPDGGPLQFQRIERTVVDPK